MAEGIGRFEPLPVAVGGQIGTWQCRLRCGAGGRHAHTSAAVKSVPADTELFVVGMAEPALRLFIQLAEN